MSLIFPFRQYLFLLPFALASTGDAAQADALHAAVRTGDIASVDAALRDTENVDQTDFRIGSPLHVAVVEQRPAIVLRLLESGAMINGASEIDGKTALHIAAELGDHDMVMLLLANGADLRARSQSGQTASHLATRAGHAAVVAALLDAGAVVDSREPAKNMTPLLIASLQGDVDLVKLLVEAGADIEAVSANGRTPFFYSTTTESFRNVGSDELIRFFVDRGVETSPRDLSGLTPLDWAKSRNVTAYKEIVEILSDLGVQD
ncbi:ankyrin repeat domain-containing protein [Tropicimonas sp. IMCC6043]|uniref:ankyrin repeat domain-containing protein n=1 Tax=Tropicimonas sp. IMCC6043 TaxID=2510645 RepID=UPI00101D589F|nr:ankyrin repeat domain-containing protein [Tropicimonas sp. IMCC6043]RYH10561.1 ankyrin repeat domain-containing protein [Tropicimonas sp. IMCC6043]